MSELEKIIICSGVLAEDLSNAVRTGCNREKIIEILEKAAKQLEKLTLGVDSGD